MDVVVSKRDKEQIISLAKAAIHPIQVLVLNIREYVELIQERMLIARINAPNNLFEAIRSRHCTALIIPNDGSNRVSWPEVNRSHTGGELSVDVHFYEGNSGLHKTLSSKTYSLETFESTFRHATVLLQFFEDIEENCIYNIGDLFANSPSARRFDFSLHGEFGGIYFPDFCADGSIPSFMISITVNLKDASGNQFNRHYRSFLNEITDNITIENLFEAARKAIPEVNTMGVQLHLDEISLTELKATDQLTKDNHIKTNTRLELVK